MLVLVTNDLEIYPRCQIMSIVMKHLKIDRLQSNDVRTKENTVIPQTDEFNYLIHTFSTLFRGLNCSLTRRKNVLIYPDFIFGS